MHDVEMLIPFVLFGTLGILIWKWLDSTHKQRMAMIEKGVTGADLKMYPTNAHPLSGLKWGLLAVFVGTGFLLGIILHEEFRVVDEVTPTLGLILGGVALLIYYNIAQKKKDLL